MGDRMVAVVTVLVPHFKYPFTLAATGAAVVEQDTWDDVAQCVEILLTTSRGERTMVPDYGADELTFMQDLPAETLLNRVLQWEERAQAAFTSEPDRLDTAIRDVRLRLEVRG